MLPQKRKDQIADAVASGVRAKRTAGGLTILPAASRNIVLAKHGELTAAGKHYYSLSGEQPPVSDYDPNQAPVLRGDCNLHYRQDREACKASLHGRGRLV